MLIFIFSRAETRWKRELITKNIHRFINIYPCRDTLETFMDGFELNSRVFIFSRAETRWKRRVKKS